MKKDQKRMFDRTILKGFKFCIILVLASLAAMWLPQAVCHVSAAEPVRFSTYLMIDEDGEFATDKDGRYIQLFDEKGNLLTANEDVREYLTRENEDGSRKKFGAREKAFFLIDGRFYFDMEGANLITDLSQVLPAIFKYGDLEEGYVLESDYRTVIISSGGESEDSLYIARVSGTYEKLPSFTLDKEGNITYFDRGHIQDELNNMFFVYDDENFYDENLKVIDSVEISLLDLESENEPLFSGYYITNGAKCLQFIDREGNFVISPADYTDLVTDGGIVEAKYCYGLKLTVHGEEILFLYADIDEGVLYEDYQESIVFGQLSEEVLNTLSADDERGIFAGFYACNDDGKYIRFIDESGNLINDSLNFIDRNIELTARFYQVLTDYQGEEGLEVYMSDGEVYIDPELLYRFSDIETSVGKTKDGGVIFFTYEDIGESLEEEPASEEENIEETDEEEEIVSEDIENSSETDELSEEKDGSTTEGAYAEDNSPGEDTSTSEETTVKEDAITKDDEEVKEDGEISTDTSESGEVRGVKRVKRIKRIKVR